MKRVFNKMRKFHTKESVVISIVFGGIFSIIINGISDMTFVGSEVMATIYKFVAVFILMFMAIYSILSFERMVDKYKVRIYELEDDLDYLEGYLERLIEERRRRY